VTELGAWADRSELLAILDACSSPLVLQVVEGLGSDRAVSLFRGSAEDDLRSVAPHLVAIDRATLARMTARLWPLPWGIFARGGVSLDEARTHFRRFLHVPGPGGETWYFRYYDPRVLRRYLPTCDADQLRQLLGPFRCLGATNPETYGVTVWSDARDPRESIAHLESGGRVRFRGSSSLERPEPRP
jgi:hypothetical protein